MTKYLIHLIPDFLLQYFPADKILHFSMSFVLLIVFFVIRKIFLKEKWFLRILAFSLRDVIIIWIIKEIIDLFWFWNAEFFDLLANLSGLIIPIYLFFIIKLSSQLNKSRKLIYEKKLILKFKKSNIFVEKIKLFFYLSIIWFLNIFYLILKIPFLALKETYFLLKKIYLICKSKFLTISN